MIEDYVRWLLTLYLKKKPATAEEPKLVEKAVEILCYQGSRVLEDEDFVSLVAAEMAKRLDSEKLKGQVIAPFLAMIAQVADTVRHRVMRAAKKNAREPTGGIDQIPAPRESQDVISEAIMKEIVASLSLEEQAVLTLTLEGRPVEDVARELNVSLETIYRRLKEIKKRLTPDS